MMEKSADYRRGYEDCLRHALDVLRVNAESYGKAAAEGLDLMLGDAGAASAARAALEHVAAVLKMRLRLNDKDEDDGLVPGTGGPVVMRSGRACETLDDMVRRREGR